MNEAWKPVYGYSDLYEVSNLGRVRSIRSGRIMRGGMTEDGYPTVHLSSVAGKRRYRVHRIVCTAFHGQPPFEGAEAAHSDGDKGNARADNLRWATRAENVADKRRHGTQWIKPPKEAMRRGERHPHAKLNEAAVSALRQRAKSGERVSALAAEYGIARQHAYLVVSGKQWAKP